MKELIKEWLKYSIALSIGLFVLIFCMLTLQSFLYATTFSHFNFILGMSLFVALMVYPITAFCFFLLLPLIFFVWDKLDEVL